VDAHREDLAKENEEIASMNFCYHLFIIIPTSGLHCKIAITMHWGIYKQIELTHTPNHMHPSIQGQVVVNIRDVQLGIPSYQVTKKEWGAPPLPLYKLLASTIEESSRTPPDPGQAVSTEAYSGDAHRLRLGCKA